MVANLVMEDVEQEALSTFHTPPRFWRRYIDDTCTALPSDLVNFFMTVSTLAYSFHSGEVVRRAAPLP